MGFQYRHRYQDWFDLKEREAEEWGGDDPYADDDDKDDKPTQGLATSDASPKKVYGWYSLVKKGT